MKLPTEKKGILEFFGIDEPFFKTSELKGKDLQRFVDRKDELLDLRTARDYKQNYALIGESGTGKSSLLLKFQQEINEEYYTDYIYFSMIAGTDKDMKEKFFRDILTRLLILIIENDQLLDCFDPKEIYFENTRLNFSISIEDLVKKHVEISPELEANFHNLLMGSILSGRLADKLRDKAGKVSRESLTPCYTCHTELTLRMTIGKLTQKLPSPVVLFIDEMDRIIKTVRPNENWMDEVIKLLRFASEIMTNDNLVFIFALQPEIHDIFVKADRVEGDDSILRYVPAFKKIEGFDMEFAMEAVVESLKFCGYKGKPGDLFQGNVIEVVLSVVKNNPRQVMRYLTELTKLAYKKNQSIVSMDLLKEFLLAKFGVTGTQNWRDRLK